MVKSRKETVLLTGASGAMGFEAFKELWQRRHRYNIVLLLRPSQKNKDLFKAYIRRAAANQPDGTGLSVNRIGDFRIVWGNATKYADVAAAVEGVDWILSPMALIPPEADHNPHMAKAVNHTATQHLIRAAKAQSGGIDHIKFVSIGSVAEYGDRLPPYHMCRVGDPLLPSPFDFYATTKVAGERAVIESGLKYWVSLRQTYIAIPESLTKLDAIGFHQPLNTHIEMNTARDAGYGLIQCLEMGERQDFWRRIYNFSGGPDCRLVFFPYAEKMMRLFGFGDIRDVWDRNWFALRNFHCCYFEDSGELNAYLGHWRDTLKDHYQQVEDAAPLHVKIAGREPFSSLVPTRLIHEVMRGLALTKNGPLYWIRNNLDLRVRAFFGSHQAWAQIPDWSAPLDTSTPTPIRLEHGYDETKADLALSDLKQAATFRGGRLLSKSWTRDMAEQLIWESATGERFQASPTCVLKGGHWAPSETAPPWDYDRIAKQNPFVAQLWQAQHGTTENNFYPADCYKDIV